MIEANTVMCTYRVRETDQDALLDLLTQHWPTLRDLGLATDDPATIYRGRDDQGRPFVIEIFDWTSPEATARAHEHPQVGPIWEKLDTLCEARDGRPNMEFPHVARVAP